jgi:MFS family permease
VVVFGMGMGAVFALLGVNVTGQINVAMCLAVSMASLGMCEGVFWTTATDIGGRSRGFCGAFMNALGNVGGLVSPVLTPVMAQRMGWPGAITVACLIAGVGGATWFVIQLPERQDDSVPITP